MKFTTLLKGFFVILHIFVCFDMFLQASQGVSGNICIQFVEVLAIELVIYEVYL